MASVKYSVVLGVLFSLALSSARDDKRVFIEEPKNVTVDEGESAYFPCVCRDDIEYQPSWNIGGDRYAPMQLPHGYARNRSGLIVEQVTRKMNGVSVFCFFFSLGQSRTAYITVKGNNSATETRSMILKTADSTMSANYHPMSMVTKTTVAKTITMTPGTTPLFPSRPIKDSSTLTFSYTHTFHPSKSAFVVIATLTPSIAPSTVTSPRKEQSSVYSWMVALGVMTCIVVLMGLSLSWMVSKECKRRRIAKQQDKDRVEPIYDLPFSEAKNKLTTEENEAYDTTGDNTMQRNRAYSTSVNIHHLKSLQRSSAASIENLYESVA